MLTQIKIITTTEQVMTLEADGKSTVISNKVIHTSITDENNKVLNAIPYQFNNSEVKYGIITLAKSNPLRSIYSPKKKIKVSVNGLVGEGKWHSTQVRVDGLTKTFSQIQDLEARVFNLSYNAVTNTLVFDEI